jgi:solute carrier family 41
MRTIDELIIIIPVILNLKGNLEMNLSARLGTAANMGQLDNHNIRRSIIVGNLSLLQVQATVVSFVATCVAFLHGLALPDPALAPLEYPEATRRSFTKAFYPVYIHARTPIRPHPSPSGDATVPGLVE